MVGLNNSFFFFDELKFCLAVIRSRKKIVDKIGKIYGHFTDIAIYYNLKRISAKNISIIVYNNKKNLFH